eukprot:3019738-Pleurochrysis_carterae.AAC.1
MPSLTASAASLIDTSSSSPTAHFVKRASVDRPRSCRLPRGRLHGHASEGQAPTLARHEW